MIKKKAIVLILLLAASAAVGLVLVARKGGQDSIYITAAAKVGPIAEIVSESGTVTVDDRDLFFERVGTIKSVMVKVGDKVEEGIELIALDDLSLKAEYAAALASRDIAASKLSQLKAGSTTEERAIAATAVTNAETSLSKAEQDLRDATDYWTNQARLKEIALQTAEIAYLNAQSEAQVNLDTAVRAGADIGNESTTNLDIALTDSDLILGIDNAQANDNFETYLSPIEPQALRDAENSYEMAKLARAAADSALSGAADSAELTKAALVKVRDALNLGQTLLLDMKQMLEATVATINLSQDFLNTKIALMNTDRASLAENILEVNSSIQEIEATLAANKTTLDAAQKSVENAEQDLTSVESKKNTEINAAANVLRLAEGALAAAEDEYARVAASARTVDVAVLAAAVREADAHVSRLENELAKSILRAPASGTVADLPVKEGEIVSPTTRASSIVADGSYDVEVNVSELDIGRLDVGDEAVLAIEALDISVLGRVTRIDPIERLIDADVFYRVTLGFTADAPRVRSGMSVDVSINTDERENALLVPNRAIFRRAGRDMVRVLTKKGVEERPVKLGLRGLDEIEIISGLSEGETVITGERRK